MKNKTLQTLIFNLVLSIIGFAQSNSWKGLIPLHSTSADVEEILGKPTKERFDSCYDYKYRNEFATICFTFEKCREGWNVPNDTVLRITTYLDGEVGKSFEDLNLKETDFDRSDDDAFYGSWINEDKGYIYYFQNIKLFLLSKDYIPKKSDNTLRCNGFPPYKPGSESPYIEIANFYNYSISKEEDLSNISARFENFIINFRNTNVSNNYKGYILIYFDKKLSFEEPKSKTSFIRKEKFPQNR